MRFWISKSGLEVFDLARAYGLAALLGYADEVQRASPVIEDAGVAYLVELPGGKLSAERLRTSPDWVGAFEPGAFGDTLAPQWESLFLTYRKPDERRKKRERVKQILEEEAAQLFSGQEVNIDVRWERREETLLGGLDPTAFKGVRGTTRGQYSESQVEVDLLNWALGCLGGALAGRFIYQRNTCFIIYTVPERVQWSDFFHIRHATYGERLPYLSVQNAAAHYSVVLAEHLRQRATDPRTYAPARYSNLLYFSLFKTGNQWKPGNAGRLNFQPLLKLALDLTHGAEAEDVFRVWLYLFRRGSVRGHEDLALAITELVMHPTLRAYEQHVRVIARHLAQGMKAEFQYSENALREVTCLVQPE
ncbi:MAG: hypothetical protein ACUVSP_10165 [Desulfotomaculales bacterium]